MIKAEIVADSINPQGCRLTTFVLEYPRFIHSEIMTHRMFSKNAASSRAIPIEKMIEAVQTNPAMPVWWGKNQSGMQAKEELDNVTKKHKEQAWKTDPMFTDLEEAKFTWIAARNAAIGHVMELNKLGLHKQIANRLLEPWFHMRIIMSGTDYGNFFALRAHPDAQPEFQVLAYEMLKIYNESKPKQLAVGDWHVPFGDSIDSNRLLEAAVGLPAPTGRPEPDFNIWKRKIAIARCARISYLNYEGKDDYETDIKLCDRLFGATPKHLSPTEHVARCEDHSSYVGNFRGWTQFRKTVADENLNDPRILS